MEKFTVTEKYRPYALRPRKKRFKYLLRSAIKVPNVITLSSHRPIIYLKEISLNVAPEEPKHQFEDLNDDCILHLLECMSLDSLCNMAEVSVRLKQLAQNTFRRKYRHVDMNLLANSGCKVTMQQSRRLFYNFGQLILSLHLSRKVFLFDEPKMNPFQGQNRLFWLIRKYCKLESLTMGHFWLNVNMMQDDLLPIFKHLRTLNFYRITCFSPDEKCFRHFAIILQLLFETNGLTQQTPQIVQLI